MKWQPHAVMGVGVALALIQPGPGEAVYVAMAAALGSLLPDLDLAHRHRRLLHSLPSAAVLILAAALLLFELGVRGLMYRLVIAGFATGYGSHIAGDLVTIRGVDLFWPIDKRRVALLHLRYDSWAASLLGYLVGIAGIAYWYLHILV